MAKIKAFEGILEKNGFSKIEGGSDTEEWKCCTYTKLQKGVFCHVAELEEGKGEGALVYYNVYKAKDEALAKDIAERPSSIHLMAANDETLRYGVEDVVPQTDQCGRCARDMDFTEPKKFEAFLAGL